MLKQFYLHFILIKYSEGMNKQTTQEPYLYKS